MNPRSRRESATPADQKPTRTRAGHATGAFTIRRVRKNDVSAIVDLDLRTTSEIKDAHWRDLVSRAEGRRGRRNEDFFFLVAASESDDALLGFIVGEIRAWEFGSRPCGWVYAMAVDPDAREHGIGERLLESVAGEFRRCGVRTMRTMVAKENRLPMLFFRGEGMMAGPYIQLEKDLV